MRRLAKQDREDDYGSRRDYQEIQAHPSTRMSASGGITSLSWQCEVSAGAENERSWGVGAYVRAPDSVELALTAQVDGQIFADARYHIGNGWMRVGRAFEASSGSLDVTISFSKPLEYIDVWGLAAGKIVFPDSGAGVVPSLTELNKSHLLPETLYLTHSAILPEGLSGAEHVSEGSLIELKKCSYCGRHLPTGPGTAGRLGFHKHNAKLSGHQNECRACKKWRINNSFNPLRTSDQLNESSVINRERRLLLREPEILQRVKERQGRGLKSIVWDRFGRACFYCSKPLTLKEVELDHTRPLSYLWPIDEYATCLCSEHNNHKKDRFPVDFYSEAQLIRLSELTGLDLAALQTRSVCEPELMRIQKNIVDFAQRADPRAFNAIARKVVELRPDVDLWAELKDADLPTFLALKRAESIRPKSISDAFVDAELESLEE
ncbi:HNH endonuclease [Sphingomonas sp. R86521]|uniref:HNH endonuclease n=1 Tax=Sphingomonas sp. R86521 TaxID=3093860 RepID=UPI0036D26FDF